MGAGALVRGHTPDFTLELALSDFTTSDMLLLSESLNLTDTAAVTLNALERAFGHTWFADFMKLEPGATETDPETGKTQPAPNSVAFWARRNNIHEGAAEGLHRKLKLIYDRSYVTVNPAGDPVKAIIDKLENGRHVILGFGEYDNDLDYLLVSNILTRRIRQHWIKKTEDHKTLGQAAPRPLLIAIEEAHKLLNPQLASQTAFGTIARELRKYFVTLLVVDQRPSGIDDEIMSQLGTRITGWLGDEDDIRAVLTGLAGRDQLRGMLARLQEKEEVLLLGWGVKMPIPVKSRRYDERFYDAIKGREQQQTQPAQQQIPGRSQRRPVWLIPYSRSWAMARLSAFLRARLRFFGLHLGGRGYPHLAFFGRQRAAFTGFVDDHMRNHRIIHEFHGAVQVRRHAEAHRDTAAHAR